MATAAAEPAPEPRGRGQGVPELGLPSELAARPRDSAEEATGPTAGRTPCTRASHGRSKPAASGGGALTASRSIREAGTGRAPEARAAQPGRHRGPHGSGSHPAREGHGSLSLNLHLRVAPTGTPFCLRPPEAVLWEVMSELSMKLSGRRRTFGPEHLWANLWWGLGLGAQQRREQVPGREPRAG